MSYSLIELKLRRFIYLGHKKSIYVNPVRRSIFWKNDKNYYEITGMKLIANIIAKNKTEDINSIVPTILKIEQEKKLENYEYLMYLLAVCSKFHQKQCFQMVTDVYECLGTICTDGFKLLMFYTFCRSAAKILYEHGYIPKTSLGYGSGARKAFKKWYLDRSPLETIDRIIKQKRFRGISHSSIMNTIHLDSKDLSHKMYIVYIRSGMNILEKVYGPKMQKEGSSKEQRCIYNYIKLVHRIETIKDSKSISDSKWSILGKHFNLIVPKMLQSTKVLISFVRHLPLRTLLDHTYSFQKHGLFKNLLGKQGLMEFILRFKDHVAVNESGIHPIDSYLEFLRYERYDAVISSIKKKKGNNQNMWFATNEVEQKCSDNLELEMKDCENKLKKSSNNFPNSHLYFMKPIPSLVCELQTFLSTDLVERTLKNLKPSGRQLLIAYDNRTCMESVNCQYMHVKFVKVLDAIVLLIQSLVYQEKSNKPTICALFDPVHRFKFIQVNYQQKFTVQYFKKCLFKKPAKNTEYQVHRAIRPLSTLNWAKKKDKIFDVFLFLGTSKMDLKGIRKTKANYEAFSNSKIKIIICCLTGKHYERESLCRDGMLLITGFDKNTARLINLFINNTF